MMGNHSLWGKNGSLFEDVLKVPLIVYDPGKKSAKRIKETVLSTDIYPTILGYAGIDEVHSKCEGVTLDKDVDRGGREYIISECDNRVAVVKGRYKLEWNRYIRTGQMYKEFYDLEKDPHEFENLYENPDYKNIVEDLESILIEKEKSEKLLSTVFADIDDYPYYLDLGNGAGLLNNRG